MGRKSRSTGPDIAPPALKSEYSPRSSAFQISDTGVIFDFERDARRSQKLKNQSRLQACGERQLHSDGNVDARVFTREIQLVRVQSTYRYRIGDYFVEQDLRNSTGSEVVHGTQRRGDADGPDLFALVVRERQSVQGDLAGRRREWVRCREMNEARLQVPEAM